MTIKKTNTITLTNNLIIKVLFLIIIIRDDNGTVTSFATSYSSQEKKIQHQTHTQIQWVSSFCFILIPTGYRIYTCTHTHTRFLIVSISIY